MVQTIPIENRKPRAVAAPVELACLVCLTNFSEAAALQHKHDNILTTFGKNGDIVVLCCTCNTLHTDVKAYLRHHRMTHSQNCVNFEYRKLNTVSIKPKEFDYACGSCSQKFAHIKDMKIHTDENHQSVLDYTLVSKYPDVEAVDLNEDEIARVELPKPKKNVMILPFCKRPIRKLKRKLSKSITAR